MIGTAYFDVEQGDDVTCIRFMDTSSFDTDDYAQLQRDLVGFVEREQPRKLLVDLANVSFCSTALINALLMADRRIRAGAGTMKLFSLNEYMYETLQRLRLAGTVFSIHANKSAAAGA